MFEDVVEGFLRCDLSAGDFGEDVESLAEVFGYEVSAELHLHAGEDVLGAFVGTEESVVMTGRGDDDVRIGKGGEVGGFVNSSFQFIDVEIVLGGNPQECVVADLEKGGGKRFNGSLFVYLVVDDNQRLIVAEFLYFFNIFFRWFLVDYPDDDTGFADGCVGAVDANLLDGVGGLTNAGGIDESKGGALQVDGVFDGVAGGAVNIGNDGAVVFQQSVQEC